MSIKIDDIIFSLAKDVENATKNIKKSKINLILPEVDITLSLDVEIEGKEEKIIEPVNARDNIVRGKRKMLDSLAVKKQGLIFDKIGTVHRNDNLSNTASNLKIHIVFAPDLTE